MVEFMKIVQLLSTIIMSEGKLDFFFGECIVKDRWMEMILKLY